MTGVPNPRLAACSVDVQAILRRSVASLYSHLVTRPTGRAVRQAIESQLGELPRPTLSLVDLSSVSILDYSCADEVVAKLLLRESEADQEVFFVLAGVRSRHREPIEAVLDRHRLAVVAETSPARFELIGFRSDGERALWEVVELRRRVPAREVTEIAADGEARSWLDRLVRRRLLFRDPILGDLHALSTLVRPTGTVGEGEGFQ
jgi:hypothetical protein